MQLKDTAWLLFTQSATANESIYALTPSHRYAMGDLQFAIYLYTKVLGIGLLHTSGYLVYKYFLAFVGYSDENADAIIELIYN